MNYFTVVARGKNGTLKCRSAAGTNTVVCASDLRGKTINVGDVFTYVNGVLAVVREDRTRQGKAGASKKATAKADARKSSDEAATSAKSSTVGSSVAATRNRLTVISKGENGVLRCENASGTRMEIRSYEVGTQQIKVGDTIKYGDDRVTLVSRQQVYEVTNAPAGKPTEKQNLTGSRKTSKASLKAAARREAEKRDRRRRYDPVCSAPLAKREMSDIQKLWEL